ncbi:eukaryotic translation initiation factor 3 110 kda subunit [Kockovaella imperatae]|uniref:Eukaryotic translation initiation factor 3 subunit A n=1 Tax=Kockovaella imperatae TaxID=4999 RepID=A0A1Y1ULX5_9TREE|nr:eukaryotic translation initiation factor 3 110 kda subunit [Kockovaella imperatae]ORX38486.1 eukaryotic translation initiation factor 3 110 kda subunit [Kockovaella imperatae]
MPPIYVKPDNALKRSEELLALGTSQSQNQAFENLWEVFQSRRFKHTSVNVLEPIMFKFIDLCVALSRKSHARLGLLTFKNATQTTAVGSIENVLNHFIEAAEARLASAVEQARKEVEALPENPVVDDELPLQPNAMLYDSFIDLAGDRDRIERRLIAPAQRFCWDAYDICLDIAKGNDRLEVIYQSIAHRAFNFCKIHERKSDFRRLCEQRLRKDLVNASKYGHQQHSVNLQDPDTLARHLDTRFLQLETAVELELWQEAFRTVEDVHTLVAGKKTAKPAMMANYYEKLTQIFRAEGGKQTAVFHASAWARYIQFAERAGQVPEKAPGCVLLSALAVPLGQVETKQRLIALLNLPKMPTRDALVKDAAAKHLKRVPQPIRQLYLILEVDFQPLNAAQTLAPIVSALPADYQPYLPALREVVLSRLVQELSQVYDTISLSHLFDLVKPFNGTPWETDMAALEKFLMNACRRGDINATIDHIAKTLTFISGPTDLDRLSALAVCLHNTLQFLQPKTVDTRAEVFAKAIALAEEERKAIAHRRQIVTKRRELMVEASIRREREESTAKAERAKVLAEENARREKELARQAEVDRLQRQMEATRREEAQKLAETLAAKGDLKVDISQIKELDSAKLVAMQVEQLAKEKREMDERLRIVGKRVDYLERAMRKEERQLMPEDYERQKAQDRADHDEANARAREQAIAQQKASIELKTRLGRMMPDYLVARAAVASQQEQEFQRARTAAQKKIESEKAKFKASVLARRKEEKDERERKRAEEERAEREEQERAAEEARLAQEREAEEAKARAEQEAAKAEAAEKAAKIRAEREAERAKADEQARRQREREAEAEARRAARTSGGGITRQPPSSTSTPTANGSPSRPSFVAGGGAWRAREAAKVGGQIPEAAARSSPATADSASANGPQTPTEPASGAWRPSRGRGGATPSSTRGGTPTGRGGGGGGGRW